MTGDVVEHILDLGIPVRSRDVALYPAKRVDAADDLSATIADGVDGDGVVGLGAVRNKAEDLVFKRLPRAERREFPFARASRGKGPVRVSQGLSSRRKGSSS